jgi:hypothetical protein
MADTYEVLQPDGTVKEFRAEQFEEIRRVRTHDEHDQLLSEGWLPLDEEVERGEAPESRAAWKQALVVEVAPPAEAPELTVYVLGRLREGEEGKRVV